MNCLFMVRPTAVTFLDNMLRDHRRTHRFEELTVEPGSAIAGKTLAASNLRGKGKSLGVAAKRPGEKSFIYIPLPMCSSSRV